MLTFLGILKKIGRWRNGWIDFLVATHLEAPLQSRNGKKYIHIYSTEHLVHRLCKLVSVKPAPTQLGRAGIKERRGPCFVRLPHSASILRGFDPIPNILTVYRTASPGDPFRVLASRVEVSKRRVKKGFQIRVWGGASHLGGVCEIARTKNRFRKHGKRPGRIPKPNWVNNVILKPRVVLDPRGPRPDSTGQCHLELDCPLIRSVRCFIIEVDRSVGNNCDDRPLGTYTPARTALVIIP